MPTISVVIPAFNCARYLPAAIESVLAQTYEDREILVVDDGSTDDTPVVIKPYLDRIQYIRQSNRGLPGARNTGIRNARGEYIALLDADDFWLPQKLSLQMPLFDDPMVGIVYSDFAVRYSDGRYLPSYLADRPLASEGFILESYLQSRYLFPSTMVLRRAAMEGCGLFDEEMLAAEDIELFARICLRWKVALVNQTLMVRAEGTHNITANAENLSRYTILAMQKILRREVDMPVSARTILHQELGRQYWWRGYADFKAGHRAAARLNLLRAVQHDPRTNLRTCVPLLIASALPSFVLRRLRPESRSGIPV